MISSIQPGLPMQAPPKDERELHTREVFRQFVGETVFGQMLSSMRKTVDKPAYFHGGRAEEVFQGQLDQELATQVAAASADRLADPMFELFMLQQRG
jgi:peptidoglycan hydrolase FlgJ